MTSQTYKPCPKKCGKCTDCAEFARVLKEIDITARSKYERQRETDRERVRDA